MKKILIGCEESQAVCKAFRERGFEAYSCDIQPCSGGHPEWHIQDDLLEVINDNKWDVLIAFPPCTYLSFAGNGYFQIEKYGYKAIERWHKRADAMKFFYDLWNAPVNYIALENPMGFPFSVFRKPDQTIEPYFFGDKDRKRTCIWLKNLPKLIHTKSNNLFEIATHTDIPEPVYIDKSGKARYRTDAISGLRKDRSVLRSKTFPGIANAMAEQWGNYLLEKADFKNNAHIITKCVDK